MKKYVIALGAIVLLATLQTCLVRYFESLGIVIPTAKAQCLTLIPVLGLVAVIIKPFWSVSRTSLLALVVLALGVCGFTFSSLSLHRQVIFFSPLSEDRDGAETRIYLQQFEKALANITDFPVSPLYEMVTDHDEGVRTIGGRSHVKAVIWGSIRLLSVTFGKTVVVSYVKNSEMKIITQVPQLDVPFLPVKETLEVLAASFSDDESVLQKAGAVVAPWRSSGIRAFIFYRLGTLQLMRSTINENIDPVVLGSAVDSFETAIRFSVSPGNTFLDRAILNNYAVALILRGQVNKDPKQLLDARSNLLDAARLNDQQLKDYPALVDSVAVQRNNSDELRKIFSSLPVTAAP